MRSGSPEHPAPNANSDLTHFDLIVPCGIQDKTVTSLSAELGRTVFAADVIDPLARHLADLFDTTVEWQDAVPGGLSR